MKQKYILISSLTAATMFAGCSDAIENLPGIPVESAGENYVTFEATAGGEDTRVAITDEISQFRYTWEDDDTFTVFNATSQGFGKTQFAIDANQAGTNAATFTSTTEVSYTNGETLYAFYNGNRDAQWDADGNITLDISDQDGTLTDKYQYMFGETTYDANGKNGFAFKHLVATLKVNLALPEGVSSISSVQLGTPNYSSNSLVSKATLVMSGASFDSEGQFSTGDLVSNYNHRDYQDGTLTIERTFKADANNQVTVYFYVLPVAHYYDNSNYFNNTNTYSTILVKDDAGNEYAGTIEYNSRSLFRSDVYEMNTGLYQLEDFANESTVDGSQSQPYEIANVRQFYTFMFRTSHYLHNKQGYYYYQRSYYMTSDMKLDNEMPWTPCCLYYYNTFDGQNHEISGNIRMAGALFDNIQNHCNVKNIVFNASRTPTNYSWGNRAIFVGNMYSYSTLEHCINKADVDTYYNSFPVLAWYVSNNCSIIACGNEGNIYLNDKYSDSGLVRELYGNASMIGCYDAGHHYYKHNPWTDFDANFGGLAYSVSNATISNCWTYFGAEILDDSYPIYAYGITVNDSQATINNCYWNGDYTTVASENGYGVYNNCGTFTGRDYPTQEQIDALNADLVYSGYMFDATGRIVKSDKSVVKPSIIEKW